jgi:hypothetical protein
MTTEYPLTLDEARVALVNEPPRTEVEDSEGYRWRRPDSDWGIQVLEENKWRCALAGPELSNNYTFRIIPVGHPDHSEYVAPVKRLTAEEAFGLKQVFIACPHIHFPWLLRVREEDEVWELPDVVDIHTAQREGWPIVATREEAEALVKERG